jgi:hypothetical protein
MSKTNTCLEGGAHPPHPLVSRKVKSVLKIHLTTKGQKFILSCLCNETSIKNTKGLGRESFLLLEHVEVSRGRRFGEGTEALPHPIFLTYPYLSILILY